MNAEVARRVAVRPARLTDADAIRVLEGLSPASARLLEHDLAADDRCCLVALDLDPAGDVEVAGDLEVVRGVTVVGYAAALVQLSEAQVLDLVVAPARRDEGVGSALLDALLAAVADRGAEEVTLEVAVGNEPALALYRRRGFVVEGRRPGYYRDGSDALILWRRPDRRRPDDPAVLTDRSADRPADREER